ncbi:hypothetical protein CF326_g4852 [Tilletia indica]|nr:hypothetical protein CF326_g4852 [Tilletia indica]
MLPFTGAAGAMRRGVLQVVTARSYAALSRSDARTLSTTAAATQRAAVRLSTLFMPTLKAAQQAGLSKGTLDSPSHEPAEQSLNLLLRGGYIRQSSSGVFTLLPLGLRMVQKIQRIIEEEMEGIGASRIEMPTLLSSSLWRKTGRWTTMGSELYRLQDRRGSEYVLGPTHEEEVTRLVSDEVHSGRALPVRVFQVTTKHRDEPRPRSGLLRTRAFLMKDLYTFDASLEDAAATYEQVRAAYARIFDRILNRTDASSQTHLWSGWKAAEADTGAIGGHRSHEYHMEDAAGEDHLLSCSNTSACTYAANVERAVSLPSKAKSLPHGAEEVQVHLFGPAPTSVGKGATHMVTGGTLHAIVISKNDTLNEIKVNRALTEGTSSGPNNAPLWSESSPSDHNGSEWDWVDRPEGPLVRFTSLDIALDNVCSSLEPEEVEEAVHRAVLAYSSKTSSATPTEDAQQPQLADFFPGQLRADSRLPSAAQLPVRHVDLRTAEEGDLCASCGKGTLVQHRAVEVGHTFLLGTRYSDALEVGFAPVANQNVSGQNSKPSGRIPFQMGCYGIGVTRLVGILAQRAVAAFDLAQQSKNTNTSAQSSGLLWPPAVAPFGAIIVMSTPITPEKEQAVDLLVKRLTASSPPRDQDPNQPLSESDVLIDDRPNVSLGAKLKDADLIGSSRVIIIGKHWQNTGEVEIRDEGKPTVYESLT